MSPRRALAWDLGPALLAVTCLLAGVLLRPGSAILGAPYVDGFGTQWFYDLAGRAVAGDQPWARTDLLFHPWGKDVWLHTGGNLVDALAALPLRAIFGLVAGYNAWVAVLLATNAAAGLALARAVGVEAGRRWPAALVLVLNPFVLQELQLGRPTQAWLAPAGLALAVISSGRLLWQAVLGGLLVGLSGYAYWFHGLVLAACLAGAGGLRLAVGPDRRRTAWMLAGSGLVAALCVAPGVLPMVRAVAEGDVPGLLALDGQGELAPLALRTVEGDEEGLWLWAPLRMESGSLLEEGDGLLWVPAPSPVGWIALLGLLAAGLRAWRDPAEDESPWRRALPIAGWVLLAAWCGSGPVLWFGDVRVPNAPWIALLGKLDFLRRWWWPGRAAAMVHLVAAPALAWALAALPRRWSLFAGVGVCLGLTAEAARGGWLPLASWDASGSPVLTCVREGPPGAVLNVPWTQDQADLWLQVLHRRPILGGMLVKKPAFAPAELHVLRGSNGLLRVLDDIGEGRWTGSLDIPEAAREELRGLGYGTILARAEAFRRPVPRRDGTVVWEQEWSRPRRLLEKALGAPFAEDSRFAAWALDGAPRACEAAPVTPAGPLPFDRRSR